MSLASTKAPPGRTTSGRRRHGALDRVLPLAFAGALAASSALWAQPAFKRHVLSLEATNVQQIFAVDVDGDGDIDILAVSLFSHPPITWYENGGGAKPVFTKRPVPVDWHSATAIFGTDLDGDGDTDMLAAFSANDVIAWFENNGGAPRDFTGRTISTSADGATSVFAADLDGDGDTDALSVSRFDTKLAWYENDGGSPPSFDEHVVSTKADRSVHAADLDGDGDVDLVVPGYPRPLEPLSLFWYENDGATPPAFTEREIQTHAASYRSVVAADMDADGDIDVVAGADGPALVAWYENDGSLPPAFELRTISTTPEADAVFAQDLDGDLDVDVLAAHSTGSADDAIYWYQNDGRSPPAFLERLVAPEPVSQPRSVTAADIEGDGDIDLLAASFNPNTIAWYEQGGPWVSVRGMSLARVSCTNLTTGETGTAAGKGGSWNCEDLGVSGQGGERIVLSGEGVADDRTGTVRGALDGLFSLVRVTCRNLTTAQVVSFNTPGDSWDCEAQGLVVSPGDRLQQVVGWTL